MGEATEQSGWATVEFSIASVTSKLGAFDSTKSVSVRITLKNDAFGYGVPGAPARICLGDSNTTVALGSACLASSDQCPEGRKPSRAGASSCVPGPCPAGRFGQVETSACISRPVGRFASEKGSVSLRGLSRGKSKKTKEVPLAMLSRCTRAGKLERARPAPRGLQTGPISVSPGQVLRGRLKIQPLSNLLQRGCSADVCCEMARAHDLSRQKLREARPHRNSVRCADGKHSGWL